MSWQHWSESLDYLWRFVVTCLSWVWAQARVLTLKTLEAAGFLHRTIAPRLTSALLLRVWGSGHIRVTLIARQLSLLRLDHAAPEQRAPGGGRRDGGEEACWSTAHVNISLTHTHTHLIIIHTRISISRPLIDWFADDPWNNHRINCITLHSHTTSWPENARFVQTVMWN